MGLKRRTKRHHNNTPICFAHLSSGCSTNHLGLHWSRYELHNRTSIHSEKLIITISPKELITCTISSLLAPVAS